MADDPMLGRVIGGHTIIEPIGAGGMGAVYRAVHVGLGQTRAIKLLPPALATDPVLVERFKREARTAASLRHPNVVQIYDVGSEDGTHYIVMALVSGRSLLALLRSEPLLSYMRVVRVLRQLAAALDAAHRAGIVHRDVKSGNVIVGDDDHVTLVDFGIASVLEATRLTVLASPGTPSYMSPEQVRREPAGPGFDLYALGVVAYEMLTGRLPFLGDPLAVVLAHRDEPPPPPRVFRPTLPPAVDAVLLRQLAKSPPDRYRTGGAFVEALDTALMSVSPPPTFGDTATTTTTTTTNAPAPGPSVPPMKPRVAAPIPGPPTPNPSGPAAVRTSGRRTTPVFGVVLAVGLVLAAVGYGGVFGLHWPGSALPGTVTPTPDVGTSQIIVTPDAPRPVTLTVPPTDVPTREPTPTRVLTPTPTPPPKIVPENVERIAELRRSDLGVVASIAFSPDGQFVASGSADGPTRLWRASDGAPLETLDGHTDTVWRVAFSPDGQTVASGSEDKTVRLWRASDGAPLQVLTGHTSPVWSVTFSPDGQTVASGSVDGSIRLWRVGDGSPLRTLAGHTQAVTSVAFSPDGQTIASGAHDDTVRLWRASDGALLHTLTGHMDDVLSVAFSPDGQTVASGSFDRMVRFWRRSDGSPLRTLSGHTTGVTTVAFSPDGQTVVSGSLDLSIRLWRASDGSLLRTIARHSFMLRTVAFSYPDGQTLASGSGDGAVKFWGVRDTPPASPSPAARPAASPAAKPASKPAVP